MKSKPTGIESIAIRRAVIADSDKVRYRVYSSPTEFIAVIAESALMAVKVSGISKPHKIVRDLPTEGIAIEAKKMASIDPNALRITLPTEKTESEKQLVAQLGAERNMEKEKQESFKAMNIADLQNKGGPRARILPPEMLSEIIEQHTRAEYETIVSRTIEQIRAGNFYQANITRKFYGSFDHTPDSWQIFEALCAASPAPYSAYIRHGSVAVLSSSPECLLTVDSRGTMTTRPIKGSARRGTDETSDAAIRDALKASDKNHAENLMIVDLMRNDLSRVSEPQTVNVVEQSALYSYRTIHHLISTIQSKKLTHVGVYDAVRACFPAGSMTGAPKIAAIAWCEAQEKMERGLYSGAIGWFGGGNTCDLSVVIRTLIIDGECFEFQVGGGIVADSTPTDEWRETMTKARGIIAALGLREEDLARL
jgi:anthranilate/para-aminobenzoate synthase component I